MGVLEKSWIFFVSKRVGTLCIDNVMCLIDTAVVKLVIDYMKN